MNEETKKRGLLILPYNSKKDHLEFINKEINRINYLQRTAKVSQTNNDYSLECLTWTEPLCKGGENWSSLSDMLYKGNFKFIHFCGHGSQEGLHFDDTNSDEKIDFDLIEFLDPHKDKIDCVILNACYSRKLAEKISYYIKYAIGMNQGIEDRSAYNFAVGFYKGLADGLSIEDSFHMGCSVIREQNFRKQQELPEDKTPQLFKGGTSIHSSSTLEPPTEEQHKFFDNAIRCKEYALDASEAYDSFGIISDNTESNQNTDDSKKLEKLESMVEDFWINGFLAPARETRHGQTTKHNMKRKDDDELYNSF